MKYITTLLLAIFLFGCSTITGYKPVVNERADKNTASVAEDLEYCKSLALQTAGYAGDTFADTATAAAYAASIGAVSGAMISGATSAGTAAGFGGAVGGITGLFWGLYESDETFKRSYARCMAQLNHPVLY